MRLPKPGDFWEESKYGSKESGGTSIVINRRAVLQLPREASNIFAQANDLNNMIQTGVGDTQEKMKELAELEKKFIELTKNKLTLNQIFSAYPND